MYRESFVFNYVYCIVWSLTTMFLVLLFSFSLFIFLFDMVILLMKIRLIYNFILK